MKPKYPVLYLPTAEQDLVCIFDYIRRDSPSSAASFLDKMARRIARLATFPLSGAVPKDPYLKQRGYRLLSFGNYLIFYKFEGRKVILYRILHGKRRFEFLLDRTG